MNSFLTQGTVWMLESLFRVSANFANQLGHEIDRCSGGNGQKNVKKPTRALCSANGCNVWWSFRPHSVLIPSTYHVRIIFPSIARHIHPINIRAPRLWSRRTKFSTSRQFINSNSTGCTSIGAVDEALWLVLRIPRWNRAPTVYCSWRVGLGMMEFLPYTFLALLYASAQHALENLFGRSWAALHSSGHGWNIEVGHCWMMVPIVRQDKIPTSGNLQWPSLDLVLSSSTNLHRIPLYSTTGCCACFISIDLFCHIIPANILATALHGRQTGTLQAVLPHGNVPVPAGKTDIKKGW
jgi:hypothetical protein